MVKYNKKRGALCSSLKRMSLNKNIGYYPLSAGENVKLVSIITGTLRIGISE
jgi:hypothetical protein